MSRGTARLMQARMPGTRQEEILDFGERRDFGGFSATLLPAGHIFGSAQIYVESDAGSLLYTGDFKMRPSLSAEPLEWRKAETLIMETTFGLPRYRMPPTSEVMAQITRFCNEALEEGAVPILLGYSLGKSQEILCALLAAGLKPMLHASVHRMTEVYRELRPDFPEAYERFVPSEMEGKVLVFPPSAARSLMVQRIKNRRTAMLTGWALDPNAKFRYGCDAAFPLSDHADYPDLLRYVDLVQPKRVLTLHGFAAAFARDLRERGIEAWALSEENQLELMLGAQSLPVPPASESSEPATAAPPGSLLEFAQIGKQIEAASSKLRKIEILSRYLRTLSALSTKSLAAAAVYLTGRPFAQSSGLTLQIGSAIIRRAVAGASGKGESTIREIGRLQGDSGRMAFEAMLGKRCTESISLEQLQSFLDALRMARGPLQKTALLEAQLAKTDALQASYLVKILTGDLRIGLKEGLVEEAIAAAFNRQADAVREASMLLGDIGETALLAVRDALHEAAARLFHPVKCMLASPEPTAEAVWTRLSENGHAGGAVTNNQFWMEDKYDGIRAQVHVGPDRAEIFSRDLRSLTGQFADIARMARGFEGSAIFDGEIIAYSEGKALTFFDLQKRLGRKHEDDLFLGSSDIPVKYQVFDLLWLDGRTLLGEPLSTRRDLLASLALPPGFTLAPLVTATSPEEVEAAFVAARNRGNEGLIAKDATSTYVPGRRGQSWLKLKKELATLDVVIVGAESGHGKRSGVLSDYTFAVRDDATGALLPIGKAYSGVSDDEIDELTELFRDSTTVLRGRFREVRPEVVIEVAFDSIQPSDRHASGLALRFPRIKAIRRDKGVDEIDTLQYARTLSGKRSAPGKKRS